jgi:hypothetical protein
MADPISHPNSPSTHLAGPKAEAEAPPSTAPSAPSVRERRSAEGNEGIGHLKAR